MYTFKVKQPFGNEDIEVEADSFVVTDTGDIVFFVAREMPEGDTVLRTEKWFAVAAYKASLWDTVTRADYRAGELDDGIKHQYRKRPVVVEAFQMTRERRRDNSEWPVWLHDAWQREDTETGSLYPHEYGRDDGVVLIKTLEGVHKVSWGDWIIRGVAGELYPCKPDIFEATYEKVHPGEPGDYPVQFKAQGSVDPQAIVDEAERKRREMWAREAELESG